MGNVLSFAPFLLLMALTSIMRAKLKAQTANPPPPRQLAYHSRHFRGWRQLHSARHNSSLARPLRCKGCGARKRKLFCTDCIYEEGRRGEGLQANREAGGPCCRRKQTKNKTNKKRNWRNGNKSTTPDPRPPTHNLHTTPFPNL